MNFRLHEVFAAVCDRQSISRAAEALHMTQPAVTHAVKRLEADTGLTLFDRLSNRLYLTDQGRAYLAKTRQLLDLCAEMEEWTAGDESRSRLRIGTCITIAWGWLPGILRRFREVGGDASVRVAPAETVVRLLDNNDIDVALYEGPVAGGPYVARPFSTYRVVAACACAHRFARMRRPPLAALLAEPLLVREPGSAVRDVFDSFLRLRQTAVEPFMTSVNSQALAQAARAGLGVCIIPEPVAADEVKRGGLVMPAIADFHLENENSVLFHRDKRQTEAMRLFVDCVKAEETVPS